MGEVPGGDGGALVPAGAGHRVRPETAPAHGGTKIAKELYALANNGATGAMTVVGNFRGTVFLEDGRITFAESPGIPDPAARLVGSGRLSEDQWPVPRENPARDTGALLLERGLLGEEELRAVLHSVVLDVLIALLADRSPAADVRFAPLERHWAGRLLALDPGAALAEAERRSALPAVRRVSPRARPKACELLRPWAVLRREHWPLLQRADGVRTVRDLAWHSGLALHDTIESVDALAHAGLCVLLPPVPHPDVPEPAARPPGQTAPPPRPALPAPPSSAAPAADPPLPHRVRGASAPPGADALIVAAPRVHDDEQPVFTAHPDVLRRVLEGLKRLGR
ncbi:DUF4388 domain-containing protein [uncultured Thermomonospora sp.]|uniref:DUF4388 domain-containing protein n=1 Tax=uncultured Thermomonospora sp. TaxID=671175 RepID=UPI00338E11F2